MNDSTSPQEDIDPRQSAWSPPVSRMKVSDIPEGAMNLNVEGRQPVSPLQGFGQMWQKTFKVRLSGVEMTPAEVMKVWKENFPKFQPPENRFYPTMSGLKPGEVVLIDAKVPPLPGTPSILPVSTGVLVMYADDTTITVMTPEGIPNRVGTPSAPMKRMESSSPSANPCAARMTHYMSSSTALWAALHSRIKSGSTCSPPWQSTLE